MAEKMPNTAGFRLDLGEPLATQLSEFCVHHRRKKTEVIREALDRFFKDRRATNDENELRSH
jgi:hypothetical protein